MVGLHIWSFWGVLTQEFFLEAFLGELECKDLALGFLKAVHVWLAILMFLVGKYRSA
jgi:hypothetical protein